MRRTAATLVAAMLVVGTLAAFPVAGLAAQTDTAQTETADENASVAPGAQLAGVVGVGEAELEGDVDSRAYGIQVAQARTDRAKADVVAERLDGTERRLEALEREKDELDEARANGSMSEDEYRAKAAVLHARTKHVERLANQSNDHAAGLPADLLREKGINATAIQTLRDRATELGGPEVAAIAKGIAGEDVGQSARPAAAGERGQQPGDAAGTRSDTETRGDATDGGSDPTVTATERESDDRAGNASDRGGR